MTTLKIIRFREAEMLVAYFPFKATVADNSTVVQAESDDFEKSIRWGYIRHDQQRNGDIENSDAYQSGESSADGLKSKIPSVAELAKMFVDSFGDRFFERVEGSHSRVRIHLPMMIEFTRAFVSEGAPLEEYLNLNEAMKALFLTYNDVKGVKIHKSITLHDLVRFQRLILFLCLACEEYFRRANLLGTPTYYRSLVTHFSGDVAKQFLKEFCGIAQPEDLLELLCEKHEAAVVFDILYKPILKVSGQYLIPAGLIANSNIIRNALQTTRFRFDADDNVDPIGDFLVATFKEVGVKAATRVKYRHDGRRGEVDVLAIVGNRLFAFECKNSLHPCNTHELRQSYGYIVKGFEQLGRFREAWRQPEVAQRIGEAGGLDVSGVTGLTTCVVTGNRMFSGYVEGGHAVRNIYELANAIGGGWSEFTKPVNPLVPDGPKEVLKMRFWSGDTLQSEDLVAYIEGDSLPALALSAMEAFDQIVPLGRTQLRFRSFRLDLLELVDRLRQHQLVRVEAAEAG